MTSVGLDDGSAGGPPAPPAGRLRQSAGLCHLAHKFVEMSQTLV